MNKTGRITIFAVLIVAISVVVALKQRQKNIPSDILPEVKNADLQKIAPITVSESKAAAEVVKTAEPAAVVEVVKLPRLVELGSDRCIPCKQMTPILAELTAEYAGKLKVEFYDVWKNQQYGRQFNIRVIPTQVFIGSDGKELFRHEGFYPKQDILSKWKQLGYDFNKVD